MLQSNQYYFWKNRRLKSLHSELIWRRVCVNDIKILGFWATTLYNWVLTGVLPAECRQERVDTPAITPWSQCCCQHSRQCFPVNTPFNTPESIFQSKLQSTLQSIILFEYYSQYSSLSSSQDSSQYSSLLQPRL